MFTGCLVCVMLLKLSVLHSQLISGDYLNSEPYHMLLLSAVLLFRSSVLISHKFLSAMFVLCSVIRRVDRLKNMKVNSYQEQSESSRGPRGP